MLTDRACQVTDGIRTEWVTVHQRVCLSAKPIELWADGTLARELGLPNPDRARVEVIDGYAVVPPMHEYYEAPDLDDVEWEPDSDGVGVGVEGIPESCFMDIELFDNAQQAHTRFLLPARTGQPAADPESPWVGYALFHVPCHLLTRSAPNPVGAVRHRTPGVRQGGTWTTFRLRELADGEVLAGPLGIELQLD